MKWAEKKNHKNKGKQQHHEQHTIKRNIKKVEQLC